jgi:hypothetical protein
MPPIADAWRGCRLNPGRQRPHNAFACAHLSGLLHFSLPAERKRRRMGSAPQIDRVAGAISGKMVFEVHDAAVCG